MARFVDLELEDDAPDSATTTAHRYYPPNGSASGSAGVAGRAGEGGSGSSSIKGEKRVRAEDEAERPNPNRNAITEALGTYPYVSLTHVVC